MSIVLPVRTGFALLATLAATVLPAAVAAQREPPPPTPVLHLVPLFNAGGISWSTRSVGALGGSVQVELGRGTVVGAFGAEGWAPLRTGCLARVPVCESPDYGAGIMGAARWRHPLGGGRRRNDLVVGLVAGGYYWQGSAATLDPDPGFMPGIGLELGTDVRATRRRPGARVLASLRLMSNGATVFTASVGPRLPL